MKKLQKINQNRISPSHKHAICLLTFQPTESLFSLYLDLLNTYDIYAIVDDNSWDISILQNTFPTMNFIQINEDLCKQMGYTSLSYLTKKGEPHAWDKAMLYFCETNTIPYNHIWFIEDDVFLPKTNIIPHLDKSYNHQDLLIRDMKKSTSKWTHYKESLQKSNSILHNQLHNSLVCIMRLSKKFIEIIRNYVQKHHQMFFLEAFYPSLAIHHKLSYQTINAFKYIVFKQNWNIDFIMKHSNYVFHPVKDITLQHSFRNCIQNPNVYLPNTKNISPHLKKLFKFHSFQFIQTIIFQNNSEHELHLISTSSPQSTSTLLQLQIYKNFSDQNIFQYSVEIPSIDQYISLLINMNYQFHSIIQKIQAVYTWKQSKIIIENIPTIPEFAIISSNSQEQINQILDLLHLHKNDITTFDQIIYSSNQQFQYQLIYPSNLVFENLHKSLSYVKNHKSTYQQLIKNQSLLLQKIIELFTKKPKIYDLLSFYQSNIRN